MRLPYQHCFLLITILACFPVRAQEITTESLIRDYEYYNSSCRGGSGDESATWEACGSRNYIMYLLNVIGVCYGKTTDEATFQYQWHACTTNSFRSTERPSPNANHSLQFTDKKLPNSFSPDFEAAFQILSRYDRARVQEVLKGLGYYIGNIDALWGAMTESSLEIAYSHMRNNYQETQADSTQAALQFFEYLLTAEFFENDF